MHKQRLLLISSTFLAPVACGYEDGSTTHRWDGASAEKWVVGEPAFSPVGEMEGPSSHVLFRPRRPLLSPSGLISVADARSEIRYFTWDGSFVGSIGRRGSGPGEFERLGWYDHLPGGGVIAEDFGYRLVVLDSSGRELTRSRLEVTRDPNIPPVLVGSDAVAALENVVPVLRTGRSPSPVAVRMTARVLVYTHEGTIRHVAGEALGPSSWVDPRDGTWMGLPLGARPSVAAFHDYVAVSNGVEYEVRFMRPDGSQEAVWNASERPPPANETHLERWIASQRENLQRAGAPPNVPILPPPFDDPPLPDRLPGYWALLFDLRGCLWAERYPLVDDSASRWDVIDPADGIVAQVSVPSDIDVSQVGDIVVGLTRDELGVARVVGRRVVRPRVPKVCGSPFG